MKEILEEYFRELHTKDIYIWGSGRYFKNRTLPFLKRSELIKCVRGFVQIPGQSVAAVDMGTAGDEASDVNGMRTEIVTQESLGPDAVILIAVSGYREAMEQLAGAQVVPSLFLEALYEDFCMLNVTKPPVGFRKHEMQRIPKVIHTCWFSGEAVPAEYQRCVESWKKWAPDMKIKIWTLDTYQTECTFFKQAVERKMWAFAADYARADILCRYGGVYMDMDVEMHKPIDDLLYNDAYMSFESLDRIECGSGIGAQAGNRILKEICESYEARTFIKPDGSLDYSTCPVQFTKVIERHGLVKNGGFQMVEDIMVYPFEVLTGKSFDTGIIYQTDLSVTVHHHHGSWVPGSAKTAMDERYREIGEFLKSLGNSDLAERMKEEKEWI